MKPIQQIMLPALLIFSSISYVYAHGTDHQSKTEVIHQPITKEIISTNKTKIKQDHPLDNQQNKHREMPMNQTQHSNHSHK